MPRQVRRLGSDRTARRPIRLRLVGCALLVLAGTGPAFADAIDGDWCSDDGRHMTITGPSIVTPGGSRLQGAYTRHSFVYTVPANEPDAGQEVTMRLLSEMAVQVRAGPADRPSLIWHRCQPTTS
jgi:hypothetical protein